MKSNRILRISKGFTVLELMTVVAVFAISISFATPSYNFLIKKYRLKGAIETIVSNLQSARGEAIKLNANTYVVFNVGGNWTLRSSNSLACANNASGCSSTDWTGRSSATEFSGTNIDSTTFSSDTVTFDHIRGTSNIGAITISLEEYSVDVKLNKLGYIKICSNNALTASNLDYVAC